MVHSSQLRFVVLAPLRKLVVLENRVNGEVSVGSGLERVTLHLNRETVSKFEVLRPAGPAANTREWLAKNGQ